VKEEGYRKQGNIQQGDIQQIKGEQSTREISEYRRLIGMRENTFGKKGEGMKVVRVMKKVRKRGVWVFTLRV